MANIRSQTRTRRAAPGSRLGAGGWARNALSAILGRSSFIASVLCGLAVGLLLFPFAGNRLNGVIIAFGAICIAAVAARQALARDVRIQELSEKLQDEASFHAFVDGAIQGFFRSTRDGRYLAINPALARIYGYNTPEQMRTELTDIGRSLYVEPNRRAEFRAQMVAHGVVRDFVSQIRRRDGTTIWITENARTVRDADNQFLFYEGMVEDITVKRQSQEAARLALQQAQEAARAKASFLAAMSHELRTPLNAVLGFSDLILQELFGPINEPRYREYISDIHENGVRLLRLINNILDLSRIEGGLIDLKDDAVDIREAANTSIEEVTKEKTSEPVAISVHVGDDVPLLMADPRRLHQILCHLLSNAVKFSAGERRVEIGGSLLTNGGVAISVKDTGIGMERDRIAQALEPFKQLDGRLARRFEGSGLGLPLANALVQMHGGRLCLDSMPGAGTTVTIEFPPERTIRQLAAATA